MKLHMLILTALGLVFTAYSGPGVLESISVDFDEAMGFAGSVSQPEICRYRKNDLLMQFCRALYQNQGLGKVAQTKEPLIPKLVHLIWVGPRPKPDVFYDCFKSIQEHMPAWEIKVWTDAEVKKLGLTYQQYYDEETNYGAKSDILRYELLYRFGGVYIDADMILTKPLDILHHSYEFYCCLMPCSRIAIISNGIIGSAPGHPIIKECLDTLHLNRTAPDVLTRTGPLHFQQAFYNRAKIVTVKENQRIVALPKNCFFPFDFGEQPKTQAELIAGIKAETFAVHMWSGSWTDQENRKHHTALREKLERGLE